MLTTVIIPTYNEANNLPRLVPDLLDLPLGLKLLIVDDNSPDDTGHLADGLAQVYPGRIQVLHRAGKLGLKSAYMEGFKIALEAGTDSIAQMDADLSHDPAILLKMVEQLQTYDVVLGSRYVPGGGVDEKWSVWRKLLSAWANYYARTLLRMPVQDLTTGYRLWRADTLRRLPFERIHANGYIFLVEMAYLAYCLGYRIGEIPIHFSERSSGASKMTFKIQVEAALMIWRVRWGYRDLRGLGKSARG